MKACVPLLAVILALVAPAVRADAQPAGAMPAAAPHTRLIHVNRCDPQSTYTVTPAYPGFAPGFYPRGPYIWPDPYGYRYYQAPLVENRSGVLYLDYMNVGTKVATTIDFGLLANGRLVAEVRDVGTFSPNAEIKHQFGLNANVFPIATGLPVCIPLRIVFQDGTKWRNPRLPALRRELYGSTPNPQ